MAGLPLLHVRKHDGAVVPSKDDANFNYLVELVPVKTAFILRRRTLRSCHFLVGRLVFEGRELGKELCTDFWE